MILIFGYVAAVVHLISCLVMCRFLGIAVEVVSFGFGPLLKKWKTSVATFELRLFPIGGFVKPNEAALQERSKLSRILVEFAGPASVFFSAAVCVGISAVMVDFASSYRHLYILARDPHGLGQSLVKKFLEVAMQSKAHAYAILATKFAIMNLLPLPTMSGGKILFELLGLNPQSKFAEYLTSLMALCMFFILYRWATAVIPVLFN